MSRGHLVGYHTGAAGGVWHAVLHAVQAGAKAFAFFTRSSRTWTCPALKDADAAKFKLLCKEHGFDCSHILPHGTYLSNSGSGDADIRGKSIAAIKDEMRRCVSLGLSLYNFHPGSTCGKISTEACLANVAAAIDECCAEVPGICLVIETMAGGGGTVCSSLEEIATVISRVSDKSRVGVCIDTAHVHAAGYDIRTQAGWDTFMDSFDKVIGLQYLKGLHLNDSKVALDSRVDRHESIGKGYIGIEGFRAIMNDKRTEGVPLILETPAEADEKLSIPKYAKEIALLYSLRGTQAGEPVPDIPSAPLAASSSSAPAGGGSAKKQKSAKRKQPEAAAAAAADAPESADLESAPAPPKKKRQPKKSAAAASS